MIALPRSGAFAVVFSSAIARRPELSTRCRSDLPRMAMTILPVVDDGQPAMPIGAGGARASIGGPAPRNSGNNRGRPAKGMIN